MIEWFKKSFKEYTGFVILFYIFYVMFFWTLISQGGILAAGAIVWVIVGAAGLAGSILLMPIGVLIYSTVYRPAIIMAIKIPVAIIKILVFIFIQLPLYGVGHSSVWIWNLIHASISNTLTERKADDGGMRPKYSYVVIFLLFLSLAIYIVGVDFSTFTAMMRDAAVISIPLVLVPFVLTLMVSAIHYRISTGEFSTISNTKQFDYNPQVPEVGQSKARATVDAPRKGAEGIYKGLKHVPDDTKRAAVNGAAKGAKYQKGNGVVQVARGGLSGGMSSILRTVNGIPVVGNMLRGVMTSAMSSASGAGGAAAGLGLIGALIVLGYVLFALVVLLLAWLFIMFVIWASLGTLFYIFIMPFMADVFGVGGAYAANIGGDISGAIGSGPGADLGGPSATSNALSLAGARISCMLEGPQCMQEWRYNNTERPGSESVGQEFGLEIEDFNVNSGLRLDISTRRQSDTIPVQFDAFNPIHGLRGIEARDVQYRVAIDGGPTTNCVTDWRELGGQFLGENDNAIAPGGFARPTNELDDLSLKNCGALQPGYSQNMEAELQIRYDYSSQSTLQFEAMSEDYMLDQGIRPEPTQSQTASTPVTAYVNVQSPVVFRDRDDGRAPNTFPVWFGFETDRFDLEYQVEPREFEIHSSNLLTDVERASPNDYNLNIGGDSFSGSCEDISYEGGNEYSFSSDYSERILDDQEDGNWYTRDFGPTPAECTMVLDSDTLNSISSTGETVSIRVDAIYTVTLSSETENFEVINNRCGRQGINCPMIVAESDSEDGLISPKCDTNTDIQATEGCTVVENNEAWASDPQIINEDNSLNTDIENRETAYRISTIIDDIDEQSPEFETNSQLGGSISSSSVGGLEELPSQRRGGKGGWILYKDGDGFVDITEVNTVFCPASSQSERTEYFTENNFEIESEDDILYEAYRVEERGWWEENLPSWLGGGNTCPIAEEEEENGGSEED